VDLRLLRTVRHLRPAQVVARASFVLERAVVSSPSRSGILERRYARQLAAIAATVRDGPRLWRWPPAPLDPAARADAARAAGVLDGRFTFLNQPRLLPDPVDWSAPGASRLWRFHLHSFEFAVDLAAAARRRDGRAYSRFRSLVGSWLRDNPVSADDAWHPFVASGRLIAWVVARDLLTATLQSDAAFAEQLRRAILTHALFVDEHLETDVGGNHLLKNLVALLMAGCAFDGPAAERWRARAARLLERQLPLQVLPDGGHYERSPMYHALVLADLLAALFPAGRRELAVAVPLADAVRRMQRYAITLVHPDGDIPLFNDSALAEAPPPARLVGPSTEPLSGALAPSGYFLLPAASDSVLIADCGPPGPDDLPAHVHADALAVEASVAGRRVLVDGGVAGYESGPLRDHLRGTAAHNTVVVDGQDQSEVWGSFRVGRRARVHLDHWSADERVGTLVGHHDGYARLGVRHERRIDAVVGVGWRVMDALYGRGRHTAVTRYRLHPAFHWRRAEAGDYVAVAVAADGDETPVLRLRPVGRVTTTRERGLYAERFSQVQDVDVLCLTWSGEAPLLAGCWLLLPGREPVVV